ncbi:hypothetical protein [Burkholderia glumae]|uniref:hypothetical protein n=1 Tax=Burkholderia glumae TaxID=337 RepID=UPI00148EB261|nr:hypothetical protein [Burkholderia glumae]MCQ0029818.1 hypothetical protein [Burkholderia glumae]MCQ0036397.1 hypothetical protein [Burkholderia glumae]QJW77707.1 hypothetical protein GAS18_02345 [Burkholderia glumae]
MSSGIAVAPRIGRRTGAAPRAAPVCALPPPVLLAAVPPSRCPGAGAVCLPGCRESDDAMALVRAFRSVIHGAPPVERERLVS